MTLHVALTHKTEYRYDRLTLGAAGDPAAAGAALPHADPALFADGRARASTSSTGSRTRSATTWRAWFPGQDRRAFASRSIWSPTWRSSIRSTSSSRSTPSTSRSPTSDAGAGAGALSRSRSRPDRGCARYVDGAARRTRRTHASTSWSTSTGSCSATSATSSAWSPACRRRRRRWRCGRGSCRDFGLAAGADPAPSRPRRALRLRLSDPAQARREAARRPGRRGAATSPTCTPGPKSICRAPAGSGSTRPPACSPAKATSRSPARPIRHQRRADHRRASSRARSSSTSR